MAEEGGTGSIFHPDSAAERWAERGHVVREKTSRILKNHCLWAACFPDSGARQVRNLATLLDLSWSRITIPALSGPQTAWTSYCPFKRPCLGRDDDPVLLWL